MVGREIGAMRGGVRTAGAPRPRRTGMFALAMVAGAAWMLIAAPSGHAQDAEPDTTIRVFTYGSNLEFEPYSFSAPEGARVRLVYTNEGSLPHNLVIVKDADEVDALGVAAYDAAEHGFVPLDTHADRILAYTALASPGESVEVTFVMPEAGEYTFVCLFPGHHYMMLGRMRSAAR